MSKIHEALKKAQEERTQGRSTQEREPRSWSPVTTPEPESKPPAAPSRLSESEPTGAFNLPPVAPPVTRRPTDTRGFRVKESAPVREPDPNTGYGVKRAWLPDPNVLVFSGAHAKPAATEQFRTLRSRLYSMRETTRLKRILITSAVAGEGKTFVVSNIAQAIAREKNRRVLIIDGDLRKTRLHVPFGAPPSPGLADYLREQADESQVIQYGPDENLCLIAGGNGSANAAELLSNGRMQRLMESVEAHFDWIIVDSPPCLPVADAGALAGICDGVLLVVRARSTAAALVQKARKELQKRNVIGAILNSVEEADTYGHYHSYGYGYGHIDLGSDSN